MKSKTKFFVCLGILFIIIFFWLIAPLFQNDVWKGSFQISNPDSLLFARELEQSLLKGQIQKTDNYAAFPYETKTGFAPFYIYFLFTFVNFIFSLFPKLTIDPLYIAATLPVVIPWLTILFLVISIYKLSKDRILTLFCALGMLPSFSAIMVSGFFNLDYDYLISLYIWIWLVCGAFYINNTKKVFEYLGGITTAFFISTWTGCPFFYFFVTLYCFVIWLKSPKSDFEFLNYTSSSMLIGSIVALIFVPRNEDTYRYFLEMNVGRYSFLHGIIIFIGSIFLISLNYIKKMENPRKIALFSLAFLSITIILIFHQFLLQATGIIFQKDPIHSTISELSFGINLNNIHTDGLKDYIFRYGPFLLFFPFCFIFDSELNKRKELRLILHWLGIFILLAIFYQVRYIRWLGCGYGLLVGFSCWTLWNMLKDHLKITPRQKYHQTFLNNCSINTSKIAVGIFPFILISIIATYSYNSAGSKKLNKEDVELFNFIIENTLQTSGYDNNNKPEYGILAYWDLGNSISFYTKRPVATSNSMWGYKTMADVFSSESEVEAYNLCKKLRLKYINVEPPRPNNNNILSYWQVLKSMPESPEYKLYYGDVPQKDSFDYFYFWLKDHLGLTKLGNFETTNHFRVIFANKNEGSTISKNIFFECVEGAICVFKTEPETNLSLSIELKLSQLSFIYKIDKIADENGICKIILPYSNGYNKGNIITDSFYKVSFEKDGKKTLAKLVISNDDVVEGKTVDMKKQLEYLEN